MTEKSIATTLEVAQYIFPKYTKSVKNLEDLRHIQELKDDVKWMGRIAKAKLYGYEVSNQQMWLILDDKRFMVVP